MLAVCACAIHSPASACERSSDRTICAMTNGWGELTIPVAVSSCMTNGPSNVRTACDFAMFEAVALSATFPGTTMCVRTLLRMPWAVSGLKPAIVRLLRERYGVEEERDRQEAELRRDGSRESGVDAGRVVRWVRRRVRGERGRRERERQQQPERRAARPDRLEDREQRVDPGLIVVERRVRVRAVDDRVGQLLL